MPTYVVTHEDGRKTTVNSDSSNEAVIKKQAQHSDMDKAIIADRRGLPRRFEPSLAVSVEKVKD